MAKRRRRTTPQPEGGGDRTKPCDRLIGNPPETCHLCDTPLPPGRSRWCSRTCNHNHMFNHRWTQARAAAKRAAWVSKGMWRCAHCKQAHDTVQVNHIEPCKGRHGQWGCWHHQDNLEVLCVPCHLAVTAEQRKAGKI